MSKEDHKRRFKQFRVLAKVNSQKELAELAGIPKRNIENWEQGVSLPDFSQLAALSKVGDIRVLFGGHTQPKGEAMTTIERGPPKRNLAEAARIIAEETEDAAFTVRDLQEALVLLAKAREGHSQSEEDALSGGGH